MIEQTIRELEDGRIQIDEYRIKRIRSHKKNGFIALTGERISSKIIDRDTYIRQGGNGLAKSTEVLP